MTVKFPDLLACPQCRTTMSYKGGNKEGVLSCIGCSLTFPVINAIPRIINEDEKEKHEVVWLKPDEVEKFLTQACQNNAYGSWPLDSARGKPKSFKNFEMIFTGLDTEFL